MQDPDFMTFDAALTGAQTATVLCTPTSGRRLVLSWILIKVLSASAKVTVFRGADEANKRFVYHTFDVDGGVLLSWESGFKMVKDEVLYVTTTAGNLEVSGSYNEALG